MIAAVLFASSWAIGAAVIWIVGAAMFLETVWRTRIGLRQALAEDALFLSLGFGFGLTWPIVLIGCGASFGIYQLARRSRQLGRG